MVRALFAPNGTRMETASSVQDRTARLLPAAATLNGLLEREYSASSNYANPITGSSPPGLGFTFGDSWRRTNRGTMEFTLPAGQVDNITMAFRFSVENVFVNKALRLKTYFTTRGLKDQGPDDSTNDFFGRVRRQLRLDDIYRMSVYYYYSVGLVAILLPPKGKPLDYAEVLDPRMVRVQRAFGKTTMYLVADDRMLRAVADKDGRLDPRNKDYYDAMPADWKEQLQTAKDKAPYHREFLIKLEEGSFICIQNRLNAHDRTWNSFDGTPLQPYFAACEHYRNLMSGDFAAGFLAKNLIALATVGDPKAEGDNYVRPDDTALMNLQLALQNPNQAQWMFADSTTNIRYITPDPATFDSKKYAEPKEQLKNLLPSPFWYNDGGGSFAAATVEMKQMEEEMDYTNEVFDQDFWTPIYERSAEGRARVAGKNIKPPKHVRNSLKDYNQVISNANNLYANGGMDVKTLMEEHGYDPDTIVQRLKDQQTDTKTGIFMPAFEQKQNIVASKLQKDGVIPKDQPASPPPSAGGGKPGRRKKAGSRPQAESQTSRTPRPGGK